MEADFRKPKLFPLAKPEVSDKGSSGQRQPEAGSEVPSDSADAQQNPLSLVVEFESRITGWWQLKYLFIFTPKIGEDEPILTI